MAGILLLTACVTKRIPEGQYLLDKTGMNFIYILPDSMKSSIPNDKYVAEFADSSGLPSKVPFKADTLNYLFKDRKYPGTVFGKKKNLTRAGKRARKYSGDDDEISVYDLEDILKQTPNRKIFGFMKFHLWLHELLNPERVAAHARKKHSNKLDRNIDRLNDDIRRNQKRLLKGKKPKELRDPKPYRKTFGQWLMNVVGEAPVILDSAKTEESTRQINTYLLKHGYFNAIVRDTTIYHKRKPKATVYYIIEPEVPYRINSITRIAQDPQMQRHINNVLKTDSLIKPGDILNTDVLEKERKKIEAHLANRGYYTFKRDYIFYRIDTIVYSLDSHLVVKSNGDSTWVRKRIPNAVNIKMEVTNVQRRLSHDSLVTEPHKIHYIRNVHVITDYTLTKGEDVFNYDTVNYNLTIYGYNDKLKVRPYILSERIFLKPGYKYRADEVEATYKQLSNLGVYRSINIKFNIVSTDSAVTYLECVILLAPSKRQSYSIEGNGTNKAGNLGVNGALVYRHKNLFKGAERLSISMTGGLEAQQLIANQDSTVIGSGSLNALNSFNTIEFGPVVSFDFPKIIFFDKMLFRKWVYTGTGVKTSYNFQRRPDFTRSIQEASVFFEGRPVVKHAFKLGILSLSALQISNQSDEFIDRLNFLNDPVLFASFNDHIISSSYFNYTYNDQDPNKKLKNVVYYNSNFEWSGNTLRLLADQLGLDYDSNNNSYRIFGIRFAQYLRLTQEFRFYRRHNVKSESVFRLYGGLGIPGQNLHDALPFERSFFVGGSNGIRAWRARTLGPGHYLDSTFTERFDKIGDIHLEGNFEYRFDFLDFIEGALFVDAGNIWLMNPSNSRPGGDFSTEFWKDIAIGGGIGFRIDLDFFIVRLDFATKLRDPALPVGEKWFYEEHTTHDMLREDLNLRPYRGGINVNFGIGYPF